MTRGTVWINAPAHLDVHIITEGLIKNGFKCKVEYVYPDDEEGTVATAKGCIAVISAKEPWNKRTLPLVKNDVKLIMRYGVGYDNVDIDTARECGIAAFNTVGCNSVAVAEVALMHMLNINRHYYEAVDMAKQGKWGIADADSFELDGKTVGIYGAGHIGQAIARLLKGFYVKVLAYDIVRRQGALDLGVEFVESPEDLFRLSDIVTLHIPLYDKTEGIIDKKLLSLMKPDAILINTARGGIVNDEDLLEALREKRIRAAGIDVLRNEPVRADEPFVLQDNAFVTPHIGASSYEAKIRSENYIYQAITEFFDGKYDNDIPDNYLNPPQKA